MSLNNKLLKERKRFFDPHPGFMGASMPIPKLVKRIADFLDGKIMTVEEAVLRLQASTNGTIKVIDDAKVIMLFLKFSNGDKHSFRVIKYRDINKNPHR